MELAKRYSKDFVVVETPSARRYSQGHELRELVNGRTYLPIFVFLDAYGNKVLENRGFNNEHEARAMHEFVSTRAYSRMSFQEFQASFRD